ncbi:hypothetical protein CRG98_017391 [Punica granatum]|uniref:Uncharacterized protein n=1 Tax=Punica granatum TaxID=22663 RepID=A0A2I0K0X1_PUNGR|nr:hypothetical protein CRG98_017391 [Punica granatum]
MDSREPRGLTAFPLRGSAERSHGRDTSCYACMTIWYMDEKSRGRGLESRKTRLGRYGLRDPRGDNRGRSGKTRSARLLRSRHGARSGSLDSLGVGSGGCRNTGWFSGDFGRFRPWQGAGRNLGVGWRLRAF